LDHTQKYANEDYDSNVTDHVAYSVQKRETRRMRNKKRAVIKRKVKSRASKISFVICAYTLYNVIESC
jgi:hypothetical protein